MKSHEGTARRVPVKSIVVLVAGLVASATVVTGTTPASIAWFACLVVAAAVIERIPRGRLAAEGKKTVLRGIAGALAASLFCVGIAECCDLANFSHFLIGGGSFHAGPLLANALLFLVLYVAIYFVTWNPHGSAVVLLILTYAFAVTNATVFNMRGTPLDASDLAVATTAASVAGGGMKIEIPAAVLPGLGLLMVALAVCGRVLPPKRVAPQRRCDSMPASAAAARLGTITLALALVMGATLVVGRTSFLDCLGCPARPWYPSNEMRSNGFVATFWRGAAELLPTRPSGYSEESAADAVSSGAASFASQSSNAESISQSEKPTIIFVQNESLADLSALPNGACDGDALSYIHSLSSSASTGQLTVSTFGGATILTEWEVLTGCSSAFSSGDYPYINSVSEGMPSFVRTLSQQGYECVANHPCNGGDYSRKKVFAELGFDRFYTIDDYDASDPSNYCMDYISDEAVYDKTFEIFEQRDTSKPLFIFDITMQNHVNYDYRDASGNLVTSDIAYEGGKYPHVEQYLAREQASDAAFEKLVEYFSNVDSPVIIVLYGDHLPELDSSYFYDAMGGQFGDAADAESVSKQLETSQYLYRTPLVIWSNYGLSTQDIPDMSANYLFPYVIDRAGLSLDPFGKYLLGLHQELPVVANALYEDSAGTYHSYAETTAETGALDVYEAVQYAAIHDNSGAMKPLFEVSASN